MKVLILSSVLDKDAQIVKWGLQNLGCVVTIMDWERFPTQQHSSWEISATTAPTFSFFDADNDTSPPFDVIWNRRPGQPVPNAPKGSTDFKIIHTESSNYLRNVAAFLGHDQTLWVNSLYSAHQAEQKIKQLVIAKKVGFTIPATLISNDFNKVKAFFDAQENGIIYKAFSPGKWRNSDGSATVLRTAPVTIENFSQPEAIRSCPGIYQAHIQKAYELRINVFGNTVLAGKIDSQAKGKSVDWRYDGILMDIALAATILPQTINDMCIALCSDLGLAVGCIDMIVDLNGDYVFLEINQAGQFLWNEALVSEMPILDTFCRYLASGGNSTINFPEDKLTLERWKRSPEFAAVNNLIF
jgi:glutathione synthase/RimK-type ligase-like ATP-grasp enzyme